MSVINNVIQTKLDERTKAFAEFRSIYSRLDKVIEALYRPGLYTCSEYEKLASEYNNLQIRADRMEQYIRQCFPSKDIDVTINWLKSNYFEDEDEDET